MRLLWDAALPHWILLESFHFTRGLWKPSAWRPTKTQEGSTKWSGSKPARVQEVFGQHSEGHGGILSCAGSGTRLKDPEGYHWPQDILWTLLRAVYFSLEAAIISQSEKVPCLLKFSSCPWVHHWFNTKYPVFNIALNIFVNMNLM